MKETEPYDKSTNGKVTMTLEVCDPVMELGTMTSLLDIDFEKSFVTEDLAEELEFEYGIDVEEHGIDIVE